MERAFELVAFGGARAGKGKFGVGVFVGVGGIVVVEVISYGFVVDGVFDDVYVEDGVCVGVYFVKFGEYVLVDGVFDEVFDG